jgi:hypothetical protein
MIAVMDLINSKAAYLKSELRSLGVKPGRLKGRNLSNLVESLKQEHYNNYKKAYPTIESVKAAAFLSGF